MASAVTAGEDEADRPALRDVFVAQSAKIWFAGRMSFAGMHASVGRPFRSSKSIAARTATPVMKMD